MSCLGCFYNSLDQKSHMDFGGCLSNIFPNDEADEKYEKKSEKKDEFVRSVNAKVKSLKRV